MRVLHLISSLGFFGAENVLLEIAKVLRCTNFLSVIGVIKNLHNPHLEIAEEAQRYALPIKIFPCAGRLDLKTLLLIRTFLEEQKIDIIHTHGYKSNLYALAASLGKTTPLITTCHNWLGQSRKMKLYAWLDKLFLNRFDRVTAVLDSVKLEILNHDISPRKVLTTYNGIDIGKFTNQRNIDSIKKELGIDQSRKVIGTVGRLSEEKGLIHLMQTAEEVLKKYPKLVFLIVGDGPLRKELQRKYHFAPIIFTGFRNDVPELYQCMDIFVLPSLKEGLPMVLLEAMASRKPVLATKVGAIHKVVQDGCSGLLIKPGDVEGLANGIIDLLENPQKGHYLAQNGYETVRTQFSSRIMAEKYIEVYGEVLGGLSCFSNS